ncbi:Do family serine endopeptidase [Roseomonas sp. HF4]|uniref:Do family serine endopeptidase n=1 Tax=Roseomonas sp. HF4 TaxID=2562313 RepID=UPI00197D49CE|nr:Do family serine endopeptidase [Roseomonas sp. HF4]
MTLPRTIRRTALAAGLLAAALGTTALTALPGTAQTQPPVAAPRLPGPSFADVVERVAPAVVRVTAREGAAAEAPGRPPFGRGLPGQPGQRRAGQGSGFVVDADGYIVTNAHVVAGAERVTVGLHDGRDLVARVVGADAATDIALLKVESGAALPALGFGDSDRARVGDWVMAMGNPFGLGGSVTAGIVSARGRQIGAGPYDDFIQTDASINPGNSGGPLFNAAGEVVGVNTAIYSPSGGNIGIGFAVPSKIVTQVVAQLREHGSVQRGWLGVSLQRMDADLAAALRVAEAKGALVSGVEPGSPAERAGLRAGDVITAIDGRAVEGPRDLAMGVAAVAPGGTARLALLREGATMEQAVALGSHPSNRAAAGKPERPSLGISLAPNPAGGGVVVSGVAPGSPAAERGLREGDVVLRAGDREVRAPQDVVAAVEAARAAGRGAVALQVERDGGRRFVALPVQAG